MIENHVPTLETCKKLKELGFPQQETVFYWNFNGSHLPGRESNLYMRASFWCSSGEKYAAPLLSEIFDIFFCGLSIENKNFAEYAAQAWIKSMEIRVGRENQ